MLKEKIEQMEKMVAEVDFFTLQEIIGQVKQLDLETSQKVVDEVFDYLMKKYDCEWYYAYEDMHGSTIMSLLGVCDEVLYEIGQDL
jgi:hypothetical protein